MMYCFRKRIFPAHGGSALDAPRSSAELQAKLLALAVQAVIQHRLFRALSNFPKRKGRVKTLPFLFGADYGARTRHLNLGKVALYQMS